MTPYAFEKQHFFILQPGLISLTGDKTMEDGRSTGFRRPIILPSLLYLVTPTHGSNFSRSLYPGSLLLPHLQRWAWDFGGVVGCSSVLGCLTTPCPTS